MQFSIWLGFKGEFEIRLRCKGVIKTEVSGFLYWLLATKEYYNDYTLAVAPMKPVSMQQIIYEFINTFSIEKSYLQNFGITVLGYLA